MIAIKKNSIFLRDVSSWKLVNLQNNFYIFLPLYIINYRINSSLCFSVFYVFYEQYLTIWEETLLSIGLSLVVIFVVTLFLTGLSLFSAVIVVITVLMIIIDLAGLMYWWNISLNAVSLVNLVMVRVKLLFNIYSYFLSFFNETSAFIK